MNGIARAGLVPGVDISVTGYDDLEEAAIATPALTTVWNGQREVGRRAARALLDRLTASRCGRRRNSSSRNCMSANRPASPVRALTSTDSVRAEACDDIHRPRSLVRRACSEQCGQAHSTGSFSLVRIERGDPALVTRRHGRAACAASPDDGGVDAAFIDALPNLEIIANFGVGYDGGRRPPCRHARRHGHQHAGRADRGGRRHRDRPAAQHAARIAARRELSARRPLGEGGRLSADAAHAARPPRRHFRHGPHRPGDRQAARSLRVPRRLSQPAARSKAWPMPTTRRW